MALSMMQKFPDNQSPLWLLYVLVDYHPSNLEVVRSTSNSIKNIIGSVRYFPEEKGLQLLSILMKVSMFHLTLFYFVLFLHILLGFFLSLFFFYALRGINLNLRNILL